MALTATLKVKNQLQLRFSSDHILKVMHVEKVTVVNENGHNYKAEASLSAYGESETLKMNVTADKDAVLYEISDADQLRLINKVNQVRFKIFNQAYSDVILKEQIYDLLPDLLKRDKKKFSDRLQTLAPVTKIGPYWFGTGCMAHSCGADGAGWVVKDDGRAVAIIMETGKLSQTFMIYGADENSIPEPLLDWANDNGMTIANYVVARDFK
jgi:hypothetical protein